MRRAALVVVPLLLAACGGGSADTAAEPCGTLPTPDPAASLPSGFPGREGQVLHGAATQGKTGIVFDLVRDDDFVGVRDALVDRLKAAGYEIVGTDQEAVEAEAEFTGPHEGTIKVQPLCEGYVTVRYKLTG